MVYEYIERDLKFKLVCVRFAPTSIAKALKEMIGNVLEYLPYEGRNNIMLLIR